MSDLTREYKGKVYLAVQASTLLAYTELSCAVYVHLPKNNKIVKIRDVGQFFDTDTIELYKSGGHTEFFILDPNLNPESYAFPQGEGARANPPLPPGYVPMDPKQSVSGAGSEAENHAAAGKETPDGLVLVKGELPQGTESDSPEAAVAKVPEQTLDPAAAGANTVSESTFTGAKSDPKEERILRGGDPEAAGSFVLENDAPVAGEAKAGALRNSGTGGIGKPLSRGEDPESEKETRFGRDPEEKDTNRTVRGGPVEAELKRRIAGGAPEEEEEFEKRFGGAWASKDDKEIQRIGADIAEMEAGLTKVAGGKEFVEELKKIAAGEVADAESAPWKTSLSEDSPKLRGLSPTQAATVKLSYAVSTRLGQLRRELNQNMRFSPDAKTKREEIQTRRGQLQEEIRKFESTLVLLETMDDDEVETSDLPPDLQGKDKLELVRFVAARVEELKGTTLLKSEDAGLVRGRIEMIKSKGFQVYGEAITRVEEKLKQRSESAKVRPIAPQEAGELEAEAKRELKAARTSANITKKLTGLRSALTSLLVDSAKNGLRSSPKENAEREEKAMRIQEAIRDMESLALQVDSGQEPDPARIAPFLEPEDPADSLAPGEDPAVGITRILGSLSAVKARLVSAKIEAADAEAELAKRLDGQAQSPEAAKAEAEERAEEEEKAADDAQVEFKTLVSGRNGKEMQAGVYAAAIFRFFGYDDDTLERELVTACYLHDFLEEQLEGEFTESIRLLHRSFHNPLEGEPMALRDLSQAVRMARSYNEMPGVVTGKFAIDPGIFAQLCDRLWQERDPDVDYQLVERARQRVTGGQSRIERERLIGFARELSGTFAKWQQAKAAERRG